MPSRSFPAYAVSVPTARGFVTELLDGWPGEVQETAALLVSELATNAVRHGSGQDFDVSVRFGPGEGALWVGVTDSGPGSPSARKPPVTDEHGRGLQLVGLLATRWGVRRARGSNTKTLWFELTGEQAHPEQDAPGQEARPQADSGENPGAEVLRPGPVDRPSASQAGPSLRDDKGLDRRIRWSRPSLAPPSGLEPLTLRLLSGLHPPPPPERRRSPLTCGPPRFDSPLPPLVHPCLLRFSGG